MFGRKVEAARGGSSHNQGPSIADAPVLHAATPLSAKQHQQLMSVHAGPLKALRTKNYLCWKWRRRKQLNEKAEPVKICKKEIIKGYKKNQKEKRKNKMIRAGGGLGELKVYTNI